MFQATEEFAPDSLHMPDHNECAVIHKGNAVGEAVHFAQDAVDDLFGGRGGWVPTAIQPLEPERFIVLVNDLNDAVGKESHFVTGAEGHDVFGVHRLPRVDTQWQPLMAR